MLRAQVADREILHYPLSETQVRELIKASHPAVSLPSEPLGDMNLSHLGFQSVEFAPPPEPSSPDMQVVLDAPVWKGKRLIRTFKEVARDAE